MDRRTFLKTTTAAAAATTAASGAVQAETAPALALRRHEHHIAVANAPHLVAAAHELTRDIAIASGGRILLRPMPGADPTAAAGAYGNLADLAGPECALFSGLPGGMALAPHDHLAWLGAGGGAPHLDSAAAARGIKAIAAGHSGADTGLWSDRALTGIEDFATARVHSFGLGRALAARIATARSYPAPTPPQARVYEIAAAPLEAILEVPATARAIWYRDGVHRQGSLHALTLARPAWDALTAADQLLIEAVATTALHQARAATRASATLMAPAVFQSLPTRLEPLPASIIAAISDAAIDVTYEEMSKTRRISAAFEAYAAFYRAVTNTELPAPGAPSMSATS